MSKLEVVGQADKSWKVLSQLRDLKRKKKYTYLGVCVYLTLLGEILE